MAAPTQRDGFVSVRGAEEHNLVDVDAPRDSLVVFTGVSGSGKSSLAFGTIYAEAQRRYFESVTPYAAAARPAGRAEGRRHNRPAARDRPAAAAWRRDRVHHISEETLVPDPSLTIRERAVAAWPGAWQGQNLRDILVTLGYDIDKPWRKLSRNDRNWILFTEEQPTVEVHPDPAEVDADYYYNGTFSSAERHIRHTLANSQSAAMRRRRWSTSRPPPARCARAAAAARGARRDLRGPRHRRALGASARHPGRSAAPGGRTRGPRARLPLGLLRRAQRGGEDDRRRPARPDHRAARARPRLPRPEPDDDDALAR